MLYDFAHAVQFDFLPQKYDLKIRVNGTVQGLPVEVNDAGRVVAVCYPTGLSIRNNFKYLVLHCSTANNLIDSNQTIHPLD